MKRRSFFGALAAAFVAPKALAFVPAKVVLPPVVSSAHLTVVTEAVLHVGPLQKYKTVAQALAVCTGHQTIVIEAGHVENVFDTLVVDKPGISITGGRYRVDANKGPALQFTSNATECVLSNAYVENIGGVASFNDPLPGDEDYQPMIEIHTPFLQSIGNRRIWRSDKT